jgi:hypothetical protein
MSDLEQGIRFVKGVLEIIEYPEDQRELYLAKFFIGLELKTYEKLNRRITPAVSQEINALLQTESATLEQFVANNKLIQQKLLKELSEKEISLIYLETFKEYIEQWMLHLKPTLTVEMEEKIMNLTDSLL